MNFVGDLIEAHDDAVEGLLYYDTQLDEAFVILGGGLMVACK